MKDRQDQSFSINVPKLVHLHFLCVLPLTVNGSCESANSIMAQPEAVEWTEAVS